MSKRKQINLNKPKLDLNKTLLYDAKILFCSERIILGTTPILYTVETPQGIVEFFSHQVIHVGAAMVGKGKRLTSCTNGCDDLDIGQACAYNSGFFCDGKMLFVHKNGEHPGR